MQLTRDQMEALHEVNRRINAGTAYVSDQAHYGRPEWWTIPPDGTGDCEDYALAKQKALIERGLPRELLRLAFCIDETGQGHCVLTVDTPAGTMVLDNRQARIMPADTLARQGYRFISRQAARGQGWVLMVPPGDPALAPAGAA